MDFEVQKVLGGVEKMVGVCLNIFFWFSAMMYTLQAGYSYYESTMKKNANESNFTTEEQEKWNSHVKDKKSKPNN